MKYLLEVLSKTRSKKESGFTLIEVLIVILIIGILAAIALPSFLNQTNRARLAEARSNVGALTRGQQAYLLERGSFGNIEQLNLGISDTENYDYEITNTSSESLITANPSVDSLNGYASRIGIVVNAEGEASTVVLSCDGDPGRAPNLAGATVCP